MLRMKFVAMILGLLGGITGFGLWSLYLTLCSCALPPQYAKEHVNLFTSSPLGGSVVGIATTVAPMAALVAIVVAVLYVVPRFWRRKLPRIGVLSGVLLAVCLAIFSISKDSGLTGAIPGILVILGGLLAEWRLGIDTSDQPKAAIAIQARE